MKNENDLIIKVGLILVTISMLFCAVVFMLVAQAKGIDVVALKVGDDSLEIAPIYNTEITSNKDNQIVMRGDNITYTYLDSGIVITNDLTDFKPKLETEYDIVEEYNEKSDTSEDIDFKYIKGYKYYSAAEETYYYTIYQNIKAKNYLEIIVVAEEDINFEDLVNKTTLDMNVISFE